MSFLPISVTIFFSQNNGNNSDTKECSIDPNSEEEKSAECSLIFTINPSESFEIQKKTNKMIINENGDATDNNGNTTTNEIGNENNGNEKYGIIHVLGTGNFDKNSFEDAVVLAKKSSFIIQEFVRRILNDKIEVKA